ncbi:TadE/TadG family type IV pilus assembly protein [Arthrobacter crystallopoietes]|uniref:TadE/TadG family type IV pilus assembly protein n=1 Tax=Crystallibacter crystallopoietes TaxID=37928 RepID=UPI001ABDB97E|nr:TadE/TadG family type IV pilus assembly protein [Arthrobacter crystallopoietes]QTG80816.1 pilus assembly protein [Arthrobacter crystallopoietes]
MRESSERGAVAIEFAILLPILLFLFLGIIEFGRAYNAQITLSQGARESVRVMAIADDNVAARSAATRSSGLLDPTLMTIDITAQDPRDPSGTVIVDDCRPEHDVTVQIEYDLASITGFFNAYKIRGIGTMRCGG